MKFVCDSCGAQYMIADDKVGPKGVKVRCKKCSNVILVRPIATDPGIDDGADATVVMENPLAEIGGEEADASTAFEGAAAEAEIGAAFDTIFGGDGADASAGGESEDAGAGEAPAPAPGDPFTSAVDDAFAQALGSAPPPEEEPDDHSATRVFTTQDIQRVAQEREIAQPEDDELPVPAPAVVGDEVEAGSEWYVAIHEEQVGPLSVDEIQDRWEAGDISPDSLVWKNGMADWSPLSTIDALKDLIAPTPASSGWVAPEAEVSRESPAASAPTPAADGAAEWKPAAASLLASLAAEEMDALDHQASEPALAAPTADPVAPPPPKAPAALPAAEAASALGLDLDLPPPPAPPPDETPFPPPAAAPAEAMGQPMRQPTPVYVEPVPRPATYTGVSQVGLAAAGGMIGGHGLSAGRLVAIGSGIAVLTVALVFGGLAMAGVFSKGHGKGAKTPANATATKTPPAPAPTKAAPPKPKAAVAAAATAKTAPPKAAPPKAPPAKTAKATPPPAHHETHVASRRSRRHRHPTRRPREHHERRVASARPAPVHHRASSGGGGENDLEAAIFGNSGGGGQAAHHTQRRPRSYIPPAPGSGRDLPRSLGQGAILQVVAQHTPALRGCVHQQQSVSAGDHGKLVMSWRIRPSGRTSSVSCVTPSLRRSVLCRCISRTIRGMRFPQYGGPQMPAIEFPFRF